MPSNQLNLSRVASLALALVPGHALALLIASPSIAAPMKLAAVIVLVMSIVRPSIGLMLIAAIVPLGDVMMPLLRTPPPTRPETLVLSFIAGWLISRVLAKPSEGGSVAPGVAAAMWIFGGLLVASVATTALHLYRANPQQLHIVWAALSQSYLWTDDPIGAHTAANLIEGIALVLAVSEFVRRDPRVRLWLTVSLVCSGVAASVASGLLSIGIAPAWTLTQHVDIAAQRYSATIRDVNAAASYYLLLLGVAAGFAVSLRRTRVLWVLCCLLLGYAVTLTESRSAAVAGSMVTLAAGAMWIVRGATRRVQYLVAIPIAVVALAAGYAAKSPGAASSLEMRAGFALASVHMIRARPLFGVGVGRYYTLSRLVLPPQLASAYGLENAHDYFLQMTAELGVFGGIGFVSLLAAIIGSSLVRLWRREGDAVEGGCAAGAAAYLTTCLTGHPFLVPEAAVPFWLILGALVSRARVPATRTTRPGPFARLWPIAVGCVLLLTVPFRPDTPRLRLQAGEDGFTSWQTDERGTPFRETRAFASLFVEPNVRAIEIPMKLETARSATAAVQLVVPGAFQREVRVGHEWSTFLVDLPGAEPLVPRQRINLTVQSAVDVGQIKIIAAQ